MFLKACSNREPSEGENAGGRSSRRGSLGLAWENGASRAIREAKLDRSQDFAMKLELAGRYFVTSSTGKLPLDRKTDQVFALGLQFSE